MTHKIMYLVRNYAGRGRPEMVTLAEAAGIVTHSGLMAYGFEEGSDRPVHVLFQTKDGLICANIPTITESVKNTEE